jgi:hypothetical protein
MRARLVVGAAVVAVLLLGLLSLVMARQLSELIDSVTTVRW